MPDLAALLGLPFAAVAASDAFGGRALPPPEGIGDQAYVSLKGAGVSLVFDAAGTLIAMQLHADGHEGYVGYSDPLPHGLRFNMGRMEARMLLGPPEASGEVRRSPVLGPQPPWDRWARPEAMVHAAYGFDAEGIGMVSLMATPSG